MNLSKRLQAVATLVDINSRVIDVGCDHAYLDIYLTLNNKNKCIATDINQNALNIAKKNIKEYKLDKKITTYLTDGINGIKINKTDNIVISGMGTHTILSILDKKTLSDTLIISSNNELKLLREEVIKLGYFIDSEIFIFDKGKPYVIIKFKKGSKRYNKVDYAVGPILKYNEAYKKYLIKKNREIMKKIPNKKIFLKIKYAIMICKIKFINKKG